MTLTPHRELRYYLFALRTGLANLRTSRFRLGVRKTIGRIAQPIHGPTRFPEYYWFECAIQAHLATLSPGWRATVLDVGSPKMFGMYLALHAEAALTLTDINDADVDEYRMMWSSRAAEAKRPVVFARQEVRSLAYADDAFDIVYAMSVVEHVDGEDGDSRGVRELLRVLKPGGLLVLSVPYGASYAEQARIGFAHASHKTGDRAACFFQRIYDRQALEKRILGSLPELAHVEFTTVLRRNLGLGRTFGSLSETVRGMLGVLNPVVSMAINRSCAGLCEPRPAQYGPLHNAGDMYEDVILVGRKARV